MSAQMSHTGTKDDASITAGREDRTLSQSPLDLTLDTNAANETSTLVDNEAHIEHLEAGHEGHNSEGSPISNSTPATPGWEPSSSFATHASTPVSPLGSSQPRSGSAQAYDSGTVSEFTSPSSSALFSGTLDQVAHESPEPSESVFSGGVTRSRGLKRHLEEGDSIDEDDEPPTKHKRARASAACSSEEHGILSGSALFPIPRDLAAPRSLEPSELALAGGAARSRDLKRPLEANDSTDEDEEPPTKHRTARVSGASTSQDDVATPFEHTSTTRKRSHMAMAGEEEDDDEDEPLSRLSRKKIRKTTAYIDLTESDDEGAPNDVVDLIGSELGSSPAPSPKPQGSYLHRLPGELRNRIYRHIGLIGARLELRNFEEPALAVAIPDLKDELHSFMLSANKLRVPIYTGFRTDLKPGAESSKKKSPKKSPKKDALGDFDNSHTAPGQVGVDPEAWVMQLDPRYVTIKHICLRILESHVSESGHKHICDYFLNVSCKDGQMKVTGRTHMETSDILKRTINHMSCLATERAKQFAQQEGFEGFAWEQVRHIAASFVSVADARSRYTKKSARVTLLEGLN